MIEKDVFNRLASAFAAGDCCTICNQISSFQTHRQSDTIKDVVLISKYAGRAGSPLPVANAKHGAHGVTRPAEIRTTPGVWRPRLGVILLWMVSVWRESVFRWFFSVGGGMISSSASPNFSIAGEPFHFRPGGDGAFFARGS